MKTPEMETERLMLREVRKEDINAIFNCWLWDEDVSRYMWWKASDDIAEAETSLGMTECITTYAKVNTVSANVLHKLGFRDEETIPYECSGGDIVTEGIRCRYKAE